ncbi:MAG: hypothetical protein FJ271_32580 [Planctomycetes bacterium]|nr:hypothetical protein [Planctomycetota bacterium]
MAIVELTAEQALTIRNQEGKPIEVVVPGARQRYVLVAQDLFAKMCLPDEKDLPPFPASGIPEGILLSQRAFWKDLPELLADRRNHGQWVCYHRDERIGIAASDDVLIRECLRRGIPMDEYEVAIIRPRALPPWEPEEIESLGPWHFHDGTANS